MEDLAGWLRLQHTPGLGPVRARALLTAFGLPSRIFRASPSALRAYLPASVAQVLHSPATPGIQTQLELTLAWLEQPGNSILSLADPAYPASLLHIPDPPLVLYIKGRLELLSGANLAMVGSRNATAQGMANAAHFAASLSRAGITVVSGLALGIDTAAHQGGLQGPGSTIAVIGTGIDIVYPQRNRMLAQLIAEQGCLVSEYALGMPAIPANFPRRNRLISGLSRAVLVVEAAAQSGSLITARMALEQGRDVFAIPGSIHSALAKGCHALIKQGAKLVESVADVLEEMPGFAPGVAAVPRDCASVNGDSAVGPEPAEPEQARMLAVLGHDPASADVLAQRLALDAATVLANLLALELAGCIDRLPGGLFQQRPRSR
jgi:DNA processing protein